MMLLSQRNVVRVSEQRNLKSPESVSTKVPDHNRSRDPNVHWGASVGDGIEMLWGHMRAYSKNLHQHIWQLKLILRDFVFFFLGGGALDDSINLSWACKETFANICNNMQYPWKKLHDLHWLWGSFRLSGLLKHPKTLLQAAWKMSITRVHFFNLLPSCGACTRPLIKTFSPELDNPCSRVVQGLMGCCGELPHGISKAWMSSHGSWLMIDKVSFLA